MFLDRKGPRNGYRVQLYVSALCQQNKKKLSVFCLIALCSNRTWNTPRAPYDYPARATLCLKSWLSFSVPRSRPQQNSCAFSMFCETETDHLHIVTQSARPAFPHNLSVHSVLGASYKSCCIPHQVGTPLGRRVSDNASHWFCGRQIWGSSAWIVTIATR